MITTEGNLEANVTGGVGQYTYDWNVDADSSIIISPINGTNYEVTVTDANGCTIDGAFLFMTNAVFGPSAQLINVSPNPANEQVTIHYEGLQESQVSTLKIFDIHGRDMQISKLDYSAQGINMDVSQLHAGAYILHLVIDGEFFVQKLVIL